ncbi:hypothetical protein PV327_005879 [Microctonus hyperodae]|uniref:Uncharacterized protein n=1 Tax=Microctonus hyperodae TaxID=165561 RepID=A0AA39G2L7_MICHY|nr:hypothetical protein PV327_005879 [Microctonus hyperodae]
MKLMCTTALLFIMLIAIIEKLNSVTAQDASITQAPDFFQCKDGKHVITDEFICDGYADCDDESDESEETCKDITCGEGSFRCKYGACVSEDALCDKEQDCVDNSDETDPSCQN